MHNSVCVFLKSLSSLFISANFCLRDEVCSERNVSRQPRGRARATAPSAERARRQRSAGRSGTALISQRPTTTRHTRTRHALTPVAAPHVSVVAHGRHGTRALAAARPSEHNQGGRRRHEEALWGVVSSLRGAKVL